MFSFRFSGAFWTAAATLAIAGPAAAQAPSVGFIYPAGGQAGQKATVTLGGGNLQGATAVMLSGEGVQAAITDASKGDNLPVELTIAPDAAPGVREVRVITPLGVSNAARIWVGAYPQVTEKEPNNSYSAAQKLDKLPATVDGQINGGEDVDAYSFDAAAGDTFVFDIVAYRMASGLDPFLEVRDSRGKVLQSITEAFDRDPRVVYTFKNAGTYSVAVRDTLFRGGTNFTYRLTVGKVPVITGYLPVAARRGETVNVRLEGANLGGMTTIPVQMPMDRSEVSVVPTTPMGPAVNAVTLTASDVTEVVELEPNDTAAQATPIPAGPVAVSGKMDRAGDVDLFRFKPTAAGNLSFDLLGRRLGSRIDSYLRILDASGKQIQENDDAAGKDSRITFGVEANTEYLIEVKNQDRRSGGDVFYRLLINTPQGPDFSLTMTPDEVNLGQGSSAVVTVTAARANGFGGAIDLRLEGLPGGITTSPMVIPAGANSATFTLTADMAAAPGTNGRLRLIGVGEINGQKVEREATPVETFIPPLQPQDQPQTRPTELFIATVGPPPPYVLALDQKAVTVKRGQSVDIKISATRQAAATQAIAVAVAGQPANVTPAAMPIPEKMNEVVLKINVAANAPVGTTNVIITGNLNNNQQPAPALTLTITE